MAKRWTPREDALLRLTASMQARTGYVSGGRPRRDWPDTWRYTTLAHRLGPRATAYKPPDLSACWRSDPCGEARAHRAPPARLATGQIPNPRHGAACTEAAITHPCGPPGYTPLRLAPRKPPPTENAP